MMEVEQPCGVYDLISKLCEKFLDSSGKKPARKYLRKLRSKAYGILLSKVIPSNFETEIVENKDPFCHLLAWEFLLINQYNLPDHAKKIQKCVESLQRLISTSDDSFSGILYVLLQLRNPPDVDKGISSNIISSMDRCIKYRKFDEFSFYLNTPMICSNSKFKNSSFYIKPIRKAIPLYPLLGDCQDCRRIPSRVSCSSTSSVRDDKEMKVLHEENPVNNPDIWDLVSNSVYTEHRTWESLGNPCPEPELPFLTESSPGICTTFYDLWKSQAKIFLNLKGFTVTTTNVIEQSTFIKHIKFLLVGMTSDSFKLNAKKELHLVEGISIDGVSQSALKSYAEDLIFCGTCYKALNNLCNITAQFYGNQHKGFIFKEFCDGIRRYLSYYRVATLSLSEDSNLLKVHHHVKPLREHLDCLASICKVGPYAKSLELPSGVALLNYLYQELVGLTRKDVIMILYSILYPCIQVYFSRFLQQWIFEGTVNDPYNEFFVHTTQKFLKARSRSYWTKCYIVQLDIVPDFLMELAPDILYCGKAMNLLKLCAPSSGLCLYIMGKKPSLLTCRLNSEQITTLEHESTCYYLEVVAESGMEFSIQSILARREEERMIITDLATKKRAATIKRLELEKMKEAEAALEEKQRLVSFLRADYDKALQDKKSAIITDVLRELKYNEYMVKVHKLRKKIIEEEALKLIDYYDTLTEISDQKRLSIEKHIERLKNTDLQLGTIPINVKQTESLPTFYSTTELSKTPHKSPEESVEVIQESVKSFDSTSDSSFHSATSEEVVKEEKMFPFVQSPEDPTSCTCLDVINANSSSDGSDPHSNINILNNNELLRAVLENKEAALKNKQKVMSVEMGIYNKTNSNENETYYESKVVELSDLQKNRLKVMSSEFGLDLKIADLKKRSDDKIENLIKLNLTRSVDNENYLNVNAVGGDSNSNVIDNTTARIDNLHNENENYRNNNNDDNMTVKNNNNKGRNLKLEIPTNQVASNTSIFNRFWKSPNFELGKPTPMSIDSTPCTGFSNFDKDISCTQSISTAMSYATEEIFNFPKETFSLKSSDYTLLTSKRLTLPEAEILSVGCLKLFIQQSVLLPVNVQTKLVNNELLRYFFVDLDYLSHLNSLRNYFFLLDGEFGRNITEGLFEKLYDVNFPVDLINFRTLQNLVYHALDSSIKSQKDFGYLSFKINNLPKTFDLGNPDVLDCLSLTYKVDWPLNVLLPSDIIGKYDDVFKYLLKLNRVSWVLKKIFQDLKMLSKKSGKKESFLILSPEFNRIHHYRHIMTHFIQTVQNYVVGEVLQPSWDALDKNLRSVNSLNDLYDLHNSYIKDILFMCLLNKRFAPIRKVIQSTFVVILKFHRYLSMGNWIFDEDHGVFTHSNFQKLENIFLNFQEFVLYVFKAGRKVAKVGYQPHLVQLLDMLDINGYYTKHIAEMT